MGGAAQAQPTQYPLTLENCRETVTFAAPPKRVVAIGQTQTEILYALGLGDRIVGTAVWFSPVAKPYEAVNAKVKRLADNDPSFEAVLAQEPDLVTAMFEWHVGPNGIVAKRDRYERAVRELVDACVTYGARRNGDVAVLTRAMLGALNWTATWFRPDGEQPAAAVADTIASYLIRGLKAAS